MVKVYVGRQRPPAGMVFALGTVPAVTANVNGMSQMPSSLYQYNRAGLRLADLVPCCYKIFSYLVGLFVCSSSTVEYAVDVQRYTY